MDIFITSVATIALADLLLKSALILIAFILLDKLIGHKLNSNSRYLLWLNALFCLAVLPFLPTLVSYAAPGTVASDAWFEITVTPTNVAAASSGTFNASWLLILYVVPACWLMAKMGTALYRLRGLRQASKLVAESSAIALLTDLKTQLGISRKIELRLGRGIDTPLSFGLLTPQIILPQQSKNWSTSVMTDVLLHELSHIKRLDWITLIAAWLIASVYWINPLAWFAIKRLNEEAENSCDTAVLHAGRSDTDYAGSLLSVAQACIHSAQVTRAEKLSAQMMLDRNTLKTRIHRILEDNIMSTPERRKLVKKEFRRTAALLVLLSSGTLVLFGTSQMLSAQTTDPTRTPDPSQRTVDQEMIPLHSEMPQYPRAAADGGIEGWVQVRFTVTAAGTVDPDSVEVVDAEPADIFNASARRAAEKFEFSPRIRNGVPVDVPNVQYVFRYKLQEDPAQEETP
jgi:TonB family protein